MNPLLFSGLLELVKEIIPDKDKRKELETKITEAKIEVDKLIMQTATVPWVDAVVKLMYAFERFLSSLWRPIGSAAMTAFGLYAHTKGGMGIDEAVLYSLDAAFPAWGASRHVHKGKEIKKKKPAPLPDIELKYKP